MPIAVTLSPLLTRRTKIVATLGPASEDPATIERLIAAGADVFRLNLSHGDHELHARAYGAIREAAARTKKPVAVLADLCGPKIRTGRFAGGSVVLEPGQTVTVTTRPVVGGPGLIPSQYEALAEDVRLGDRILLDDGTLEMRVLAVQGTEIRCAVVTGGILKDRKGMNLPGVKVSAPSLTAKDRDDARFAARLGVDWIGLSFVRRADDVRELRALLADEGSRSGIVSKIEKPEALDAIEDILDVSDAIMVARGDLGVELAPEHVPMAQVQLVGLARARCKPVIVATQMLESMIEHPRPTRAEVSDVATAVWSGADAVMLSAETASGRYPVEAVAMMDRIARDAEGYEWRRTGFAGLAAAARDTKAGHRLALEDAVARAAAGLSRDLMVRAIVVFSRSGRTAAIVSAWRPQAPVLVRSANEATCRRLMLSWGTVPLAGPELLPAAFSAEARRVACDAGLAAPGDYILQVSGFASAAERSEPAVTVLRV